MGIDPSTWGTETSSPAPGSEQHRGVSHHGRRGYTKLADSLAKAAEDPSLNDELGGAGRELGQLREGLTGTSSRPRS